MAPSSRRPLLAAAAPCLLLLLLLAAPAAPATAAPWLAGDVAVSVNNGTDNIIRVFSPDLATIRDSTVVTSSCGSTGSFTAPLRGLAFSPDNLRLFAVCIANDTVLAVNAIGSRHEVLSIFSTAPCTEPLDVVFSADGSKFYVTSQSGSPGGICEFSATNGTLLRQFIPGTFTQFLALSADGSKLLFDGGISKVVRAINLATGLEGPAFANSSINGQVQDIVVLNATTLIVAGVPTVKLLAGAATELLTNGPTASWAALSFDRTAVYYLPGGDGTIGKISAETLVVLTTDTQASVVYFGLAVRGIECTTGACCNLANQTILPAGTVCATTASPCAPRLCTGFSSACPVAPTTLANGTSCAFAAPDTRNKCRDKTKGGLKNTECPRRGGPFAACAGTCNAGVCELTALSAKCCSLPVSPAATLTKTKKKKEEERRCLCRKR